MTLTIDEQVANLGHGDHICMLYSSLDEQMSAVAPYLRGGLARNELCIYCGDAASQARLRQRLTALDVDVDAAAAAGRLRLLNPEQVYLPTGVFRPDATIGVLREVMSTAAADGFHGVRTAGDMSWAIGNVSLIAYEREVNRIIARSNLVGMCQYDRARFPCAAMCEVLRVHPTAVLGEKVCPNPYFDPHPDAIDDERRLTWMIAQIEQARATELGLRQLNQELEDMTFAASHDLQEPIRMVRLHLDLVARRAERLDDDGRAHLEQARRFSGRLAGLVAAMLDASLTGNGPRADAVDVRDAIAEALADLDAAVQEAGAVVDLGELPTIRGDRILIVRLFRNLLGNALKFRRGAPRIAVVATTRDDHHEIAVTDNGIGIPVEWLPNVFGMFKRLHARDAYPGYGIGLATCRRIMEVHHGRIAVESVEGRGSTFTLSFPR